jgi:hypothetical protein
MLKKKIGGTFSAALQLKILFYSPKTVGSLSVFSHPDQLPLEFHKLELQYDSLLNFNDSR